MKRKDEQTELDLLRDALEAETPVEPSGRMDPEDQAAFELVHEATRVLLPSAMPSGSSLQIDDLTREERPRAFPFAVLGTVAAAVVLGLGALVIVFSGSAPVEAAVVLQAIPLSTAEEAPPLPVLPDSLATYRPVVNDTIQWVESLEEGRAMARTSRRPVLVFGVLPNDEACAEVLRAFDQSRVHELLELVVPVRIDMSEVPERVASLQAMGAWPYVALEGVEGQALGVVVGGITRHKLPLQLESLVAVIEGPRLGWTRLQGIARAVSEARAAVEARRLGDAYAAYSGLLGGKADALADVAARQGLHALAIRASLTLRSVQTVAEDKGGRAAVTALRAVLVRYEGTPFHSDLSRVLKHLESFNRFPQLRAASAN